MTWLNYYFRDAILTSSVNCFTSFLAGFAVFSVLGHMAKTQGTDIATVAREGNFSHSKSRLIIPIYRLYEGLGGDLLTSD